MLRSRTRRLAPMAAASLLLLVASAPAAEAGGLAGRSYAVWSLPQGGTPRAFSCATFAGKGNADKGAFLSVAPRGRWKETGRANGQTRFKVRFEIGGFDYRFSGLLETRGPGDSIAMTGSASNGSRSANVSLVGYRVSSCSLLSRPPPPPPSSGGVVLTIIDLSKL